MEKPKEKPLVLTEEIKPDVAPKRNVNPTLSPAVRKIFSYYFSHCWRQG